MLSAVQQDLSVWADHQIPGNKAPGDTEALWSTPMFDTMSTDRGRLSIPPEQLLNTCSRIAIIRVRGERHSCRDLKCKPPSTVGSPHWAARGEFRRIHLGQEYGATAACGSRTAFLPGPGGPRPGSVPAIGRAAFFRRSTDRGLLWLQSVRVRQELSEDTLAANDSGNLSVHFHVGSRGMPPPLSRRAGAARKCVSKEANLCFSGAAATLSVRLVSAMPAATTRYV